MNKKLLIAVILFPVFLILLSSYLLIFDFSFYQKEFYKNNIYDLFPKDTVDKNANELIEYMKFNRDSMKTDFFNQKEKLHMIDVRNLIYKAEYILLFVFIILIILLVIDKSIILKTLYYGSVLTILLVLMAVLLSPQFNNLFYNFHLIVFDNDLWMLDPSKDNLKAILPDQFFYDFVKTVFLNSFITSLILIFISRKDLYINKLRKLI